VFSHEVRKVARSERGTPEVALTPAGEAGLLAYLQGPVRTQLREEFGAVPREVSFIYGHTHKPFVQTLALPDDFASPVRVFNTGGWVVDTATPAPVQAGLVVLVNDDLDVAALESIGRTRGTSPRRSTSCCRRAVTRLRPGRAIWQRASTPPTEPWASLAVAAARLAAQRQRLQRACTVLRDAAPRPSPVDVNAPLRGPGRRQ